MSGRGVKIPPQNTGGPIDHNTVARLHMDMPQLLSPCMRVRAMMADPPEDKHYVPMEVAPPLTEEEAIMRHQALQVGGAREVGGPRRGRLTIGEAGQVIVGTACSRAAPVWPPL
jgi:hypothetical protein